MASNSMNSATDNVKVDDAIKSRTCPWEKSSESESF